MKNKGHYYCVDMDSDRSTLVYATSKYDAIDAINCELWGGYELKDAVEIGQPGKAFFSPKHCTIRLFVSNTTYTLPSKSVKEYVEKHGNIIWAHN